MMVTFSPNRPLASPASSSGSVVEPLLATSTMSCDTNPLPTSQPISNFENPWNVSIYEPQPPVNISTWNVPHWMPSIDFNPQLAARPEDFQFTPAPAPAPAPLVFEQLPTPPHQSQEIVPNADLFLVGSACRRQPGQQQGISSVSLRSSSPYHYCRAGYFQAP